MYSDGDTHRWVGCPIRISTDQSLLAAPHGFSQRATSFIASWCQGIHRMPLSRSKPPHTHRNHPHPGTVRYFYCADSTAKSRTIPADCGREPSAPGHPEHTLFSRVLNTPRPSGQTPDRGTRSTHQPLHTDNEHRNTDSIPKDTARSLGFPMTITHHLDTHAIHGVEADGIEPTTPCLQSRCSTN